MDLLAQLQLNEQKRMAEQEQMKKALQNRIQVILRSIVLSDQS